MKSQPSHVVAVRSWFLPLLAALAALLPTEAVAEGGLLDDLRSDVREGIPPSNDAGSESNETKHSRDKPHVHVHYDEPSNENALTSLIVMGLAAPWWVPHVACGDDLGMPCALESFPYASNAGQVPSADTGKRWGGWVTAEYADDFDDLSHIRGGMLLESTSRFGLDMQTDWLHEELGSNRRDRIWLGDANLTFRFAQCERAQWRTGLGMNWLDDGRTDLGFNFTYGFDLLPARPWVLSSELDWGTLGKTGLFRFRTTAGVLIQRVESYTGFEYLDIGRTQSSSLIAGLRLWF